MEELRKSVPDPSTIQQQNQPLQPEYSYVPGMPQFRVTDSPVSMGSGTHVTHLEHSHQFIPSPQLSGFPLRKRKRGDFELNAEISADVLSKGLISYEDSRLYFEAFFQGCVSSFLAI
jgi:hypothetical protein